MNPTRIVTIAIIAVAIVGVVAVSAGGDRVSRLGDARPSEELVTPAPVPTREARAEQQPWFASDDDDDSGENGDDWEPGASLADDPGDVPNPSIPLGVDDAGSDPDAE